jgi:hypothetical protein
MPQAGARRLCLAARVLPAPCVLQRSGCLIRNFSARTDTFGAAGAGAGVFSARTDTFGAAGAGAGVAERARTKSQRETRQAGWFDLAMDETTFCALTVPVCRGVIVRVGGM